MRFFRIALGYFLASMTAFVTIIVAASIKAGETWELPKSSRDLWELIEGLFLASLLVGGIMLIPTLIFFAFAWGTRGPHLRACLLFGGLGGLVISLILVIFNHDTGELSPIISLSLLLSGAGLVAALVFWFVAIWPRPPALPEAASSTKPAP